MSGLADTAIEYYDLKRQLKEKSEELERVRDALREWSVASAHGTYICADCGANGELPESHNIKDGKPCPCEKPTEGE